jgi:AAA15 family ATPase/GTPase
MTRLRIQGLAPSAASVRSLAIASRLADEGAKTNKGVPLQRADSITKGELIWRAVGFNSDKLADTQSTNYRMNQLEKNIENKRQSVLEQFKDADQRNDVDAYLRAGKEANKFNRMYPSFPRITQSTVASAVQGARESRGKSFKGVEINKSNAPFAVEAIAPSRRAIMRAEEEAAKKKSE